MKRILLGFSLLLSLSLSAQSWQSKPVVRIEDAGQSFLYTFSDSSDAYINKCNVSYIVNLPNSQWVQLGYMYDGSTSRIITASYSAITQPDLGSAKILSDTLNAWLRNCASSGGGGGGAFIPLSGTVSGSPVTGDIEIGQDGYKIGIKTGVSNFSGLSFTQSYMALENVANGIETSFSVTNTDGIIVKDNINHIGLIGYEDFSPYISDLGYTQKIYVDSLVGYRGTATLSSGTVTVSTPLVKTKYKIYVSVNTPNGTQGFLSAPTGSIVDGTSFVINSTSVLDNSTVNWWIAP
jgi:hypothetical protein